MATLGSLRFAHTVAWAGLAALSASLVYALVAGHFSADAGLLLANPWGLATLIDVYVGFALFSCWIVWREKHKGRAAAWVVLVAATGNIASTIYVLLALRESGDNVESFWHGGNRGAGTLRDKA